MDGVFLSFKIIFFVFAVLNLFFGLLFLAWFNSLMKANELLKKWISTEKVEQALNKAKDVDSLVINMRNIIVVCHDFPKKQ